MPALDPMEINAGELRYQVQIQTRDATPDAYGEQEPGWTTVATVWAALSTLSSREAYQAAQFVSQVTHLVKIRWSPTLTLAGGMRVLYGSRIFLIQTVENVQERNRVLKLTCLEVNGVQ